MNLGELRELLEVISEQDIPDFETEADFHYYLASQPADVQADFRATCLNSGIDY